MAVAAVVSGRLWAVGMAALASRREPQRRLVVLVQVRERAVVALSASAVALFGSRVSRTGDTVGVTVGVCGVAGLVGVIRTGGIAMVRAGRVEDDTATADGPRSQQAVPPRGRRGSTRCVSLSDVPYVLHVLRLLRA